VDLRARHTRGDAHAGVDVEAILEDDLQRTGAID
jgi:hypothetical protein